MGFHPKSLHFLTCHGFSESSCKPVSHKTMKFCPPPFAQPRDDGKFPFVNEKLLSYYKENFLSNYSEEQSTSISPDYVREEIASYHNPKFDEIFFSKYNEEYPSDDREEPKIQEHKEHSNSISSDDVKEEQSKKLSSGEVKKLEFEVREASTVDECWESACLKAGEFKSKSRSYVDAYKKGNYDQELEYHTILKRYKRRHLEPYMCIVAVRKEGENVLAVIGTLDLIFQEPEESDSEEVWMAGKKARITNVAVVKLARGQGVASRMVKFAIEIAKKRGAPQMFVKPDRDNESAQALYKKMGFTENGIDEKFNQYVYCLNL